MTKIMLDTLLEVTARDGKQSENQLSKAHQQAAADAVNIATGKGVVPENVRSCYKTLKAHYMVVRDLLNQSGFGLTYSPDNHKIVDAAEGAWKAYLEVMRIVIYLKHGMI